MRETWHRTVWQWHFYAGMVIGPILFVVAATGAVYVFRDEIERQRSAGVFYVTPDQNCVSNDKVVAAAAAHLGGQRRPARIEIDADPRSSTRVLFYGENNGDSSFHSVHVDPYRGAVLGETPPPLEMFNTAIEVHRGMFAGLPGRMIAELSASWTVILVLTGVFLWWPRRWQRGAGVFWPRWWLAPYVFWRDCHAALGAVMSPIALTIASTGLLYTYVWGQAFDRTAQYTNSYSLYTENPPSTGAPSATRFSLDEIVSKARALYPGANLGIDLPREANESYVVGVNSWHGPGTTAILVFDAYSGQELAHRRDADSPLLQRWTNWGYRLHTGSVLGKFSKVAWFSTCLVLMALPATGVWMWWQRRPAKTWGMPRLREQRLPRGALLLLACFSIALPMFGASVLAIALMQLVANSFRRLRSHTARG